MVKIDPVTQTPSEEAAYPKLVNDTKVSEDKSSFDSGTRVQFAPLGSSGTEVYAGYFAEEYLQKLRGRRGAKVWEEMLRSEAQIAMLNAAITNPIKSANWSFEPASDVPDGEKHAELIKAIITDMLDFEGVLHEILTFFRSGFSAFEIIHNVVFDHPKFGTFNGIKALAFRSQKSIERWNIEKTTGKLISVDQYVYSDVGTNATIPGDFLILFSLHKEGDNYEGVSGLRAMYGPWVRKNLYLKLSAIGVEKSALGTVIGTTPKGKLDATQLADFKKILGSFMSHESSYMMKPEGWEIEVLFNQFDPSKLKELIVQENIEMANAAVANFLALGMSGAGGAYSLGSDLSDFFLGGIQNYANLVCGVFNRKIIPDIIKMNFGEQASYPKMKCTGINDKAGKELSEIIKSMVDGSIIKADDKLEEHVRKEYKLPEADPASAREKPAPTPFGVDPTDPTKPLDPNAKGKPQIPGKEKPEPVEDEKKLAELRLMLDEKYVRNFDKSQAVLRNLMTENIATMYSRVKDDIRKKWKAAKPADRIKIGSTLLAPGVSNYKSQLKEAFAEIAFTALEGARKEARNDFKLGEALLLAAPGTGYYAKLPPNIRKIVEAQAAIIGDAQAADLEKIVTFGYTSGAAAYDSVETIINGIDEDVLPFLEGSTKSGSSIIAAAGNAVANISNQARMEFFFAPEVLETIESFTFTNEDPVSEICNALAGTTVAPGDAALEQFATPLHHNCKSRWVANLKGDRGNPEVARGGVSVSQKALDSITLCEFSHRT